MVKEMTDQYLIKVSIHQQTAAPMSNNHTTSTSSVNMSPWFLCCFPSLGGASRSRHCAVGACEAKWAAGSPAPAVLQPDAMPVGLDTEADRCHLKGNQITFMGTDGAGETSKPEFTV